MSVSRVCTLVGWSLLGATPAANAVDWAHFQVANLYGTGIDPGQELGRAVAIDGDVAVVATPLDSVNGAYSGSAFVYRRLGHLWLFEAQLTPQNLEPGDSFGVSVAVMGQWIAVGATGDDDAGNSSGAVYVFEFDGNSWVERYKLRGADTGSGDAFGYPIVFAAADLLVCGATLDFVDSLGAAYVLRFSGSSWMQEAKLTRPVNLGNTGFARVVAANGDWVTVGAPWEGFGPATGEVYLYRREGAGWTFDSVLAPADLQPDDEFGTSLAMAGDLLVVSVPYSDVPISDTGSLRIFRLQDGSWPEIQRLIPSDPHFDKEIGASLAFDGQTIIAGAPFDNQACPNNPPLCACASGAAYLYRVDTQGWFEFAKLTPVGVRPGDFVGIAVGVSGDHVIVGATENQISKCDSGLTGPGRAYVFRSVPPVYGDVNRDAIVNLDDALCLLDTMGGSAFPATCLTPSVILAQLATFDDKDIAPCPDPGDPANIGDRFINTDDLLSVLNRFDGVPIDAGCASLFPNGPGS